MSYTFYFLFKYLINYYLLLNINKYNPTFLPLTGLQRLKALRHNRKRNNKDSILSTYVYVTPNKR